MAAAACHYWLNTNKPLATLQMHAHSRTSTTRGFVPLQRSSMFALNSVPGSVVKTQILYWSLGCSAVNINNYMLTEQLSVVKRRRFPPWPPCLLTIWNSGEQHMTCSSSVFLFLLKGVQHTLMLEASRCWLQNEVHSLNPKPRTMSEINLPNLPEHTYL